MANGQEVLAQVAAERPPLIISDVMMPVVNGVGLCRALKSSSVTEDISVVLMSALWPDAVEHSAIEGFVQKPFELPEMERIVARLVSAQAPLIRAVGSTPAPNRICGCGRVKALD